MGSQGEQGAGVSPSLRAQHPLQVPLTLCPSHGVHLEKPGERAAGSALWVPWGTMPSDPSVGAPTGKTACKAALRWAWLRGISSTSWGPRAGSREGRDRHTRCAVCKYRPRGAGVFSSLPQTEGGTTDNQTLYVSALSS